MAIASDRVERKQIGNSGRKSRSVVPSLPSHPLVITRLWIKFGLSCSRGLSRIPMLSPPHQPPRPICWTTYGVLNVRGLEFALTTMAPSTESQSRGCSLGAFDIYLSNLAAPHARRAGDRPRLGFKPRSRFHFRASPAEEEEQQTGDPVPASGLLGPGRSGNQ
ncbi:uncharacterized protein THITE_2129071 [Thermothielavioides terrestris NRRL 8126]|uniref:Uncharacterized protein n=1 Tax=Thermothielavioides terrestris (strain ATCC 38088 / NRRL 8126) TaxID=578455 RepID=G2QYY6_THETT|nr:uncharacterized protein THITE_2129071 [Thermothielavioides terrestris NRRL 8126]AEO67125.1 hypothetical protein THITE_2129071 [Thermothielavioides terrestris NRRL 8126]